MLKFISNFSFRYCFADIFLVVLTKITKLDNYSRNASLLKLCIKLYTNSCPFWRFFYLGGPPGFRLIVYKSAADLLQESWCPGPRVKSDSLLRGGWHGFCSQWQIHPLSPTILNVIAYLTTMYDRGFQYNTIAAATSILSGVLHIPGVTSISSHPLIIRLLKGMFHVRPPTPRYEFIWDTDLVLTYLQIITEFRHISKPTYSENCYPFNFVIGSKGEHTSQVSSVSHAAYPYSCCI